MLNWVEHEKSFITSGPGFIYGEWTAENESGGGAKIGMFQLQWYLG